MTDTTTNPERKKPQRPSSAARKAADTKRRRYRETSYWDGADKVDAIDKARAEREGLKQLE